MQHFKCPNCEKELKSNPIDGVTVFQCAQCNERFHLYPSGKTRRLKPVETSRGSKFLASLVFGMPVTFLVLTVFAGGFENAFLIIGASIVCTAGIGLVVWVPLCWCAGAATLALIRLVTAKIDVAANADDKPQPHFDRLFGQDDLALTEYLRKANDRGISNDRIDARLRRTGWHDSEIRRARENIDR